MALTAREVERAEARDKPYKISDALGLYLYVSRTGAKSWRCNYRENGKQRTRTYGLWPKVTLAEARRKHAAAQLGVEQQAEEKPVFEAVMRDWLKVKLPSLSNHEHKVQVENTLENFVLPWIGEKKIDQIKRADLVKLCRAVEERGIIETAHRVAGRIAQVFDHAQDCGLIDSHPANGLSRVLQPRKVKKPMAAIPLDELPALMDAINSYPEPVTRIGLMVLAHTFVRTGELRGMRWDEVLVDDAVWVIPAERMKKRKPHVVPLSRQVLALLDEAEQHTGGRALVFESAVHRTRAMSENTFLFALYRLGYRGRMTGHGFRSIASTVLNSRTDFGADVIERQLAHGETNAVRAAYNRAEYLPQRREMMQFYSDFLDGQTDV